MFCTKCGKQVETGSGFCTNCGQPLGEGNEAAGKAAENTAEAMYVQPAEKKKKSVWAIIFAAISILLAAALALTLTGVLGVSTAGSNSISSMGFNEPEDAINYFIECVKNEDYEGMLRACAVDQIAENYDYEAMIKRLNAMIPNISYLPSEYQIYVAFNKSSTEYNIIRQLSWIAMSVVLPEEYSEYLEMSPIYQDIDFNDVVDDMNPEVLKSIEIVEIEEHSMLRNSTHKKNLSRQADINGADNATSRVVLYEVDGDYYVGGFQLLEYDGKWLISALNEVLIDQTPTGALIKVNSKSEFKDMLE